MFDIQIEIRGSSMSEMIYLKHLNFITDEGGVLMNCSTISGPSPNASCVFPFKLYGVTYNQCTTDLNAPGDVTPWCSILVDDSGEHIGEGKNWGNCGPNCPVELSGK